MKSMRLALLLAAAASAPAQQSIDSYLNAYLQKTGAPGFSCVVVKGDEIAYLKGFGVESVGRPAPMSPDSVSAIGSLTKSFTALAVMQLRERGLVDIDAPAVKYLPWFRLADKAKSDTITLRMLLNMRSGIASQDRWGDDVDTTDAAIERGVRLLASAPVNREPGTSFEYANENFDILGLIVSEVSGMPFREYLRIHIFEPLGMGRSSTDLATLEKIDALTGHTANIDSFVASPRIFQAMALPAGSALACSARDLGAYLAMMMNGGAYRGERLLSVNGVNELITPAINLPGPAVEMGGTGEDDYYAMGWTRTEIEGRPLVMHGGETGVMSSMTMFDPEKKIGVSLLFNFSSGLDPYRFEPSIRLCYNVLRLADGLGLSNFGIPKRTDPNLAEPFAAVPRETADRLLGSYESASGNPMELVRAGGDVIVNMKMGFRIMPWKLRFINEFRGIGVNIYGTCQFSAVYNQDGSVKQLTVRGETVYPKSKRLPDGYAQFQPALCPWRLVLPAGMRAEYRAGVFASASGQISLSIALEPGDPTQPASFLPNGEQARRSGQILSETHRGTLFYEQAFELGDGRGLYIVTAARADGCLTIRLLAERTELTRAIQEIIDPLLERTVF
jgi:CubicO group peptidase (beta-lactamase class C family)